jgi:hypothetical protein
MPRRHVLAIAALFALAAIVGGAALRGTLHLGAASRAASDRMVATRTHQLNRFERSLHRQLASTSTMQATVPAPPPSAQRVVYVRPKPIVVHKPRAGSDYEAERGGEDEGGADD